MMSEDDNDAQMIFGDLGSLKYPDICLTGQEKPRKNLTQETCPDRGSNPGPLRDRRASWRLSHSGGHEFREMYHCAAVDQSKRFLTVNEVNNYMKRMNENMK